MRSEWVSVSVSGKERWAISSTTCFVNMLRYADAHIKLACNFADARHHVILNVGYRKWNRCTEDVDKIIRINAKFYETSSLITVELILCVGETASTLQASKQDKQKSETNSAPNRQQLQKYLHEFTMSQWRHLFFRLALLWVLYMLLIVMFSIYPLSQLTDACDWYSVDRGKNVPWVDSFIRIFNRQFFFSKLPQVFGKGMKGKALKKCVKCSTWDTRSECECYRSSWINTDISKAAKAQKSRNLNGGLFVTSDSNK